MSFVRLAARFLLPLLAASAAAPAQELPGTPSGEPPRALTSPYRQVEPTLPAAPPPAVPVRPWLTIVPDLRLGVGYTDNVFITPDVLRSLAAKDGVISESPRLRMLLRLARGLGVIGDYRLSAQQFLDNGQTLGHSGLLFLGYRPVNHRHTELGVRGGLARVSEFEQNDVEEGYVFGDGTYGIRGGASFGGGVSIGLRSFPNRSRAVSEALVLSLGGIDVTLPGGSTRTERGQDDVITNVVGRFEQAYSRDGRVGLAYDFTDNDSEFDTLDYRTHRVTVGMFQTWTSWLASQATYSASFRAFLVPPEGEDERRRDTIHQVSLGFTLSPRALLQLPLARAAAIRLTYDALISASNLVNAEFDRNFLNVALEVGLPPLTSTQIGKAIFPGLYPPPPSRSFSSNAPAENAPASSR